MPSTHPVPAMQGTRTTASRCGAVAALGRLVVERAEVEGSAKARTRRATRCRTRRRPTDHGSPNAATAPHRRPEEQNKPRCNHYHRASHQCLQDLSPSETERLLNCKLSAFF